ncbi:mitochondrial import inner membrane translocase subunit Tim54 [Myxozyma melibiosi]|uniref:Mitochondrial import inner membrane translocase subunit TIM54 n=1 Tax=Myxozyma melibiosi TaxID=54550 RepID=A0ABR1F595_9ASCO
MSTEPPPPRNPVFEAMGIPRIRLPGPKMSLFLLTVGGIAGLIYYDRRERRANRQRWKDRVSFLAQEPLPVTALPRSVKVYLSPPPGDHMDITMTHFTQYVKPILTAAAIDWEVVKEYRQGDIRYSVAEEIRKQRRGDDDRNEYEKKAAANLTRDPSGGAICIGRGAYKEYLHGVHEGWLGPLEPPALPEPELPTKPENVAQDQTSAAAADARDAFVENAATAVSEADASSSAPPTPPSETESEEERKKKEEEAKKPPKPYISTADYASASTPPEFAKLDHLGPVMYVPHPHILGFRHTPIRTYRFFTRRDLADSVGRATAAVALNNTRPFVSRIDVDAGKHEEDEWPTKWKQTGLERGSEWMQDVVVDERVVEKLRVYEVPAEFDEQSPSTNEN